MASSALKQRCTMPSFTKPVIRSARSRTALDRAPSSLSRDLRRNRGRKCGYKPRLCARAGRRPALEGLAPGTQCQAARPRPRSPQPRLVARADRRSAAPPSSLGLASAMRASIASSMLRSAAPTMVRGVFTCPEPSSTAPAPPPRSFRRQLDQSLFHWLCAPPRSNSAHLRHWIATSRCSPLAHQAFLLSLTSNPAPYCRPSIRQSRMPHRPTPGGLV